MDNIILWVVEKAQTFIKVGSDAISWIKICPTYRAIDIVLEYTKNKGNVLIIKIALFLPSWIIITGNLGKFMLS